MQKRHNAQLNLSLSPLGFGIMRLPMNEDGTFPKKAYKLLAEAYERGINYFDTAYTYLGGHSEELIRETLVANYPRESFYIADKLPVWLCKDKKDMEMIFQIQLERLGVDYIDFYLLHGLNRQTWADAYSKGVLDFLTQKKAEGRIRRVGFSMHDDAKVLKLILDTYSWEFVLLQINYYDWIKQHAHKNYNLLLSYGIPCIVMEPVGGGRLAKLPDEAEKLLTAHWPNDSAASLAIRFSASLPNVAVTLSGMNDEGQLSENISVFSPIIELSDPEQAMLKNIVEIISRYNTIPCTSCCYCLDVCPQDIAISHIFQIYNDCKMFDHSRALDIEYFVIIPESRRADNCTQCNKCNERCPQKINIPQLLKKIHNTAVGLSIGLDMERLIKLRTKETKLVCFGAGTIGRTILSALRESGSNADYFCDNAEHLWGNEVDGVLVLSPEQLREMSLSKNFRVLITSSHESEIRKQLSKLSIQAGV